MLEIGLLEVDLNRVGSVPKGSRRGRSVDPSSCVVLMQGFEWNCSKQIAFQ